MRIQVTGKNTTITDELSIYAQEKIGKLERYFDGIQDAQVLFSEQRNIRVCEVTLKASGKIIRAEYKGQDFREAIDFVAEKLERQIRKFHDKFKERRKEALSTKEEMMEPMPAFIEPEEFEIPKIVRVKEVSVKSMTYDEAMMQMELLSHDFFVFFNYETDKINVLYRRKDGDYGILEPIKA